jgi:type I restriction enzyme, R subunit
LNEADTRAKLIDPALYLRGWTEDLIKREETAGSIDIVGGKPRRRGRGRTDYTLRVKVNSASQPVAVALIEAKAEQLPPQHGLEQAKLYSNCKRLNVSFVFSTNGHLFVEYDRFTGLTSEPRPMNQFPPPTDLRRRYEQKMGFGLESEPAKPLLIPYSGGEATRRYYQDAALRAVLERIAQGEKRALLTLATGSGKTFIAVNLLKRIAEAGQMRRALFICDRDELRSQASVAFQNLFGANAAEVSSGNSQKNARIAIATYQTLDVDSEEANANFLTQNYPENYFSHIVIDECHRSAWGKWSQVLKRNPDAVQIGLTATPRQIKITEKTKEAEIDAQITADNVRHFGDPVYEYDMAQGIEDGYLAACEIVSRDIFINAKPETERESGIDHSDLAYTTIVDADTGKPLSITELRTRYDAESFESRLVLPDRVKAMAKDLFFHLLATGGPEEKTIVFCASDRHADDVAIALNNLYANWCADNGRERLDHYAFKCTSASSGNDFLPDFRGASRHHFIATTVDLLSTGVDVPSVRNIVFFKYVRSAIAFYQMVGRGTRIDIPTGKLMFRVYDYTNATRLFGQDFITRFITKKEPSKPEGPIEGLPPPPVSRVEGLEFEVNDAGHFIVTTVDGRAMPITVEDYKRQLAAKLIEEAPTLEAFRANWIRPPERRALIDSLVSVGLPPTTLQLIGDMIDYDLYDVLAELGYGINPRTRKERADAFRYKHEDWLHSLPKETAATVTAIAAQFANNGTEALESPQIFQTPEVERAGGIEALSASGRPASELVRETKERMFAA